jgi:plastocyanin
MAVQVGDDFFSPQSMQVNPGDTVQWTLVGNLLVHTVTDSGGAFDSGVGFLNHPGATFSHTFTSADSGKTFSYFCQTHVSMGMKGDIKVGSNAPPPKPGY